LKFALFYFASIAWTNISINFLKYNMSAGKDIKNLCKLL